MVNSSFSDYEEPPAVSDLAQEKRESEAILAVIAAASAYLELDKVLATAMAKTVEVLGADNGSIHLLEEASGELVLQTPRFVDPALAEVVGRLKLGQSLTGLVAQRGEPILTPDLAADPRSTLPAAATAGIQSLAVVPIKLKERTLGTLACSTQKGKPPLTQRHVSLMQAIANAIAPAIENARLYQREREATAALAREKQTLEAINAVVAAASASLELEQALELALDKALEMTRQKIGALHLVDEATGELALACHRNMAPRIAADTQRLKSGGSVVWWSAANAAPILVTNTHADERIALASVRQQPPYSIACAPLMVQDKVLGTLSLIRRRVDSLTEQDLQALVNIANAVAPAIERARLIKQERETAQALAQEKAGLEAVNSVVAAATASVELNLVLKLALEKTISALGTDAGTIHLLEEGSGDLVLKAHHRLPLEGVRDVQRLKVANSLVGMAVERKEPVLVPDMTQEPRLATQATIRQGPRAMVVVPIILHDRVLGTLTTAQAGADSISPQNTKLMKTIANAIAPAIEHARLYEQMASLALTDTLTGLPNLRYLQGELERELARSRREQTPLSLLLMDIDSLKSINDQYGHQAGDRLLKEMCGLFKGAVRASEIVARYGGDEFVVALPNANPTGAEVVAQRIHQRVNDYRLQVREGKEIAAHVSIGIATFPQQAASAAELLDRADSAAYRSKARGRNQITLYPDTPVESSPGPSGQS
ncbi:MAG: GAF domain-containing protein [Chloroflexi bacterium]|nr:GAF domain-containing protein [Chloroflexota bacterium]